MRHLDSLTLPDVAAFFGATPLRSAPRFGEKLIAVPPVVLQTIVTWIAHQRAVR
jgi:hypothetical protein